MKKYLTPKEAAKIYGYHVKTLNRWANDGKIECIKSVGGHARYCAESIERLINESGKKADTRKIILYARVSTHTQKDDLVTQGAFISQSYPQAQVISEIGSGLNFKRKKFLTLMESVHNKEVKLIVVAHKDRLCRFGFDFIEWFCNKNDCTIQVLENAFKTPHQELMDDFMAVMHCFSSKLYFLRRYKNDIENDIKQGIDKPKNQ